MGLSANQTGSTVGTNDLLIWPEYVKKKPAVPDGTLAVGLPVRPGDKSPGYKIWRSYAAEFYATWQRICAFHIPGRVAPRGFKLFLSLVPKEDLRHTTHEAPLLLYKRLRTMDVGAGSFTLYKPAPDAIPKEQMKAFP